MSNPIIGVTRDVAIVRDPNGVRRHVPLTLTPSKRRLSAATVRALLATGFLYHYDEHWTADEHLMRMVLSHIRRKALEQVGAVQ